MKAVVFVDVQNDFIDGSLGVDKDHTISERIADYAEKLRNAEAKTIMVATRDTHFTTKQIEATREKSVEDFTEEDFNSISKSAYNETLEGEKLPVEHCIYGTKGWEIYPRLDKNILMPNKINKITFGSLIPCCQDEDNLIDNLCEYEYALSKFGDEITEIELVGFCTSICVISNALLLRAAFPNTKISILENLCGDINKESHEAALRVAQNCQIDIKTV